MGFIDFFRRRLLNRTQSWRELGGYSSTFSAFGADVYKNSVVRACIRPLADFTSKAVCKSSRPELARLLNNRPNLYMSGVDFLKKVRTRYEIYNSVFIYIQRDDRGHASGFYPVPYSRFEALEYLNGLFIKFYFNGSAEPLTVAWEDLAVLRKDYNRSDIAGDDNDAILQTLELINTTDQGVANAVKATANLRGILKSTKSILAPEDVKKQRDNFVRDYLSLANEGGIASLDATQEFTPIKMEPTVANAEQRRQFKQDIQEYYGVNDNVVQSKMTPEEIEALYVLRVEPFLVELSTELTSKAFTGKELGFGNFILYESNKLQFASLATKIQVFATVVQYGGMTVNEWRAACNMAPIEGGDELMCRLDAAKVNAGTGEGGNENE